MISFMKFESSRNDMRVTATALRSILHAAKPSQIRCNTTFVLMYFHKESALECQQVTVAM